jgi:WD40 repeat protein
MPQQAASCQTALVIPKSTEPNIFTPQQEVELGEIFAAFVDPNIHPIDDDALAAHLRAIADRLVAQLPPTGLRFRFYLADWPQANAASLAGGRVYVARKLVSFAKSEDEVAGVLAHELGHIVTHQQAIDYTGFFQQIGISEVGDARDIFDKYNRYLESRSKIKQKRDLREDEQIGADHVAIEVMVRAGYDPQAFPAFFDRLAENKGKTGSWWSDFFQTTRPNTKRYRELLKTLHSLPADCGATRAATDAADFATWRAAVMRTRSVLRRENLHGVVWRKPLDPPLVEDFHTLRFSPDGKYVLAQDSNSIYILTHQPFEFVFRIDAPAARSAQFTPDSMGVVFYDRQLRVERWDLASQLRTEADEVVVQKSCLQTRLAPDGRTLACINGDYDLLLVDVATGDHILERTHFYKPKMDVERGIGTIRVLFQVNYLNMEFSPDGRYFVAAAKNGNSLAFEIQSHQEVPLHGTTKGAVENTFTFLGPDRIAGFGGQHGEKSVVARFPSGELIQHADFGSAHVGSVTRGNYVLLRPIRDYAVGVLDLETNEIIRASKDPALDIYDKDCVSQLKSGQLGLFQGTTTPVATITVPRGPLGSLQITAVSDDFSWLAVSFKQHGAVWNLKNGQMAFNLRGFNGAWFGDDGALYAEFPKDEKSGHTLAHVNLSSHTFTDSQKLDQEGMRQRGRYLINLHPPGKSNPAESKTASQTNDPTNEGVDLRFSDVLRDPLQNEVLDVSDVRSGSSYWSIPFPKEVPRIFWDIPNDRVMFIWRANAAGVKAERQRSPEANQVSVSNKESNYFVEVLQISTGKVRGGFEVDSHENAFRIRDVWAAGDYALVTDSLGRQTAYSLANGQILGRIVGRAVAFFAAPQPVMVIEPRNGILRFYDPSSLKPRDELIFSRGLSLVQASSDGKKLFAVMIDQTAYLIDLSQTTASAGADATKP